jgi:hypothetical protein
MAQVNGLQLTALTRLRHGLQGQINYTWSHCLDEVSNGGFLQFSAGAILSPLPGELARNHGPCDYDIRQISLPNMSTSCRSKCRVTRLDMR